MSVDRVKMQNVHKNFAGIVALKGVDFYLKPGEIHALVGENGAGKSTLMKILSGAYTADSGEIYIDGEKVSIGNPRKGKELGVGIVYQELELADELTVAENIFIDSLGRNGIINWKKLNARAEEIMNSLGFNINVKNLVRNISVAYKQMVEIAKALSENARILILDEPTAVLSPRETEKLFETLKRLRDLGVSIVYISHRMDEIFSICDSVTIMRDGEVTGNGSIKDFTVDEVVERMIGRKLLNMYPYRESRIGEPVLEVEELTGGVFENINFNVRCGEILGLFGLVGSGRTEIARAVFGADPVKSGKVVLDGKTVKLRTPSQAKREGIALIPESRKEQGLVLEKAISENLTYCNINRISKPRGILRRQKEKKLAEELVKKLSIKAPNIYNPVSSLSGGNQQKVVIAKWLTTNSKVMIMDEPTRGVDVGAKVEIYNIMNDLTDQGVGIIMISSELNEIIGMCDRVIVIDNGHKMGELVREDINEMNIMKLVVGGAN
ncbi:MAG: sugar ABC transporter ATP-binding protein [Lachnospiraceae bacterium]|nr:sugar ABC transporter ATP-binding protein [Lachnospiraceae bacterium]MCD7956736.1 sugar ABC transporter ATP-binding protein [Lachnospiraceae bacterium]